MTRRVLNICTATAFGVCVVALTSGVSSTPVVKNNRWPFQVGGHLSDADMQSIIDVGKAVPDVSHHVRRINVKSPTYVEVITSTGPESGAGDIVYVQKHRGRWRKDPKLSGAWMLGA
jgi:hypothetical protein